MAVTNLSQIPVPVPCFARQLTLRELRMASQPSLITHAKASTFKGRSDNVTRSDASASHLSQTRADVDVDAAVLARYGGQVSSSMGLDPGLATRAYVRRETLEPTTVTTAVSRRLDVKREATTKPAGMPAARPTTTATAQALQ
jgi:hypothetical protein